MCPENLKCNSYNKQKLEVGRYLVIRKDGKCHFEHYNGTGFAYNNNEIKFYYLPKIN